MTIKFWHKVLLALLVFLFLVPPVWAGNKRIMTTRAGKVMAERALVESVYGLKVRAKEEVQDLVAASFVGETESKTSATISGIKFEEVVYDDTKDIAKVTASVQLSEIVNIDGKKTDLKNKVFRRVAFATSTPSEAGPLRALRAAELDGYNQLVKRVVGFNLESQTSVKNYMLVSDVVKTKVLATIYLAEVTEFGWHDNGDAYVKMALNVNEVGEVIEQQVVGEEDVIVVEGAGAQVDDYSTAKVK